jgi:hypothetical protein
MKTKIDFDRHVWEGWRVGDFVADLEQLFDPSFFESKEELKEWCKSTQPYYKKHVPEVYGYFLSKTKLK